jgi:uncharacterized protein (DUF427 family)
MYVIGTSYQGTTYHLGLYYYPHFTIPPDSLRLVRLEDANAVTFCIVKGDVLPNTRNLY